MMMSISGIGSNQNQNAGIPGSQTILKRGKGGLMIPDPSPLNVIEEEDEVAAESHRGKQYANFGSQMIKVKTPMRTPQSYYNRSPIPNRGSSQNNENNRGELSSENQPPSIG
jgi:hypothetical protein